ncbi:thrombospondin type 3 repeat-containing protein [Myxococcota bacterium]|nr:thrombospondin type 3 repeat-containing protein [Myxococcota bacterium]
MLHGLEPSCEQGPSSPVGLLDDMVLDEAKIVPQWRAPNRTSNIFHNSRFVQLQPNYDSGYNIRWQGIWYAVSVPWVTLEEYERISINSSPALNEQLLREAIFCGSQSSWIDRGPVIGSICITANGEYASPVNNFCGVDQESHSVVIIGWMESTSGTQAIFIDNKSADLQVWPMSAFVNHTNGIQLMGFDFDYQHFPAYSYDYDQDGVLDSGDNCPAIYNPGQEDADDDKIGDPCDQDRDGDGIPNDTDMDPDVDFFSTDYNSNGLYETSTPVAARMQIGHRYSHNGCTEECTLLYSGVELQDCIAQCENYSTSIPLPIFSANECDHRNLYHPKCMQYVQTEAPVGMTVAQYLRSYHPCALVHQARLLSFQEISARISAGELTTYGWNNLTTFNTWIAARESECVTYMTPEDWPADRAISVEDSLLVGTKSCGPTCRIRLECPNAAFGVNYTKDTLVPMSSPDLGIYWMQVPDANVMIGGCPCQGDYYPLTCSDRCYPSAVGMEPKSISPQSHENSNSWDPLYGSCPNPVIDENVIALPPHSSFCTSRLVDNTQNHMVQEKAEFYDYDLWIKETGGDVSQLGKYHELDVISNGRFRARYSKHPEFVNGVPHEFNNKEIDLAVFSNTVDFAAGSSCYPVGVSIYNWISNGLRIIPGIAERGSPAWGISKVGTEGQLILGMDTTGMHAQRSGIISDNVLNLRVLSEVDPDATTFLAARGTNGTLTSFRKYQYENQAIVDKGLISVSGIPALTQVSLVPIDETKTLVLGKLNSTTWGLYRLTVTGTTGTLLYLTRIFNTPTLSAFWENNKDPAITIIANTLSKIKRYSTNGSTLTLVYEINVNLPVRSAARTNLGLAAVLGSSVFLLNETTPNLTELNPAGLPGDLDAFTIVPRTGLRLWGRGGNGQRDGYQYYPRMETWEQFTCLKDMD